MDTNIENAQHVKVKEDKKSNCFIGSILLLSMAGISAVGGFAYTIAMAKKRNPNSFRMGMSFQKENIETGNSLALRALGWGTLYAVGGVSFFCCAFWKLTAAQNMEQFRQKMQHVLPRIPKNEPCGKSDFQNAEELVDYIINDGENTSTKDQS